MEGQAEPKKFDRRRAKTSDRREARRQKKELERAFQDDGPAWDDQEVLDLLRAFHGCQKVNLEVNTYKLVASAIPDRMRGRSWLELKAKILEISRDAKRMRQVEIRRERDHKVAIEDTA